MVDVLRKGTPFSTRIKFSLLKKSLYLHKYYQFIGVGEKQVWNHFKLVFMTNDGSFSMIRPIKRTMYNFLA